MNTTAKPSLSAMFSRAQPGFPKENDSMSLVPRGQEKSLSGLFRNANGSSANGSSVTLGSKVMQDCAIARQNTLESPLFDPSNDKNTHAKMTQIVEEAFQESKERRAEAKKILQGFLSLVERVEKQLEESTFNLISCLQNRSADEQQVAYHEIITTSLQQLVDFSNKSFVQKCEALKKVAEFSDQELTKNVELVFSSRLKEFELVEKRLTILMKQEDHELAIMTALHTLKLKEEAQKFDQALQIEKFYSDERQRHFENSLSERKQTHAETMDYKKHELEEKKVDLLSKIEILKEKNSYDLKLLEEKNKCEIEKFKAEKEADTEEKRIDADARCRMAEAASSAAKGAMGCSIM